MLLFKCPGKLNPADLYTKHLSRPDIVGHLGRMNMEILPGRSQIAPVRSGTKPCLTPSSFDPEINDDVGLDLFQGTTSLCPHEVDATKDQSSDVIGLGGCANPTHDDYPALAWCDMI